MWYEELGYDENPFELNPFKIDFKLANRKSEAEELLYRIEAGTIMLIEGKEGSGKTALLKHAIDNFKGKGKVIYINGDKLSKRLDVEELLIKRAGLIRGRLLKKKPKGMILLFDNVHQLTRKNCEKIKFYFDQDYLKSVVFTASSYNNVEFTESLRDRIGERIIRLNSLKEEDAVQIVKDRFKEDFLTEDIIREIYRNSNKNLKKFLNDSFFIAEHIFNNDKKKIEKNEVKSILKEKEYTEEEPQTNICPDCKDELQKIVDYWRCKNCDTYCKKCGALVDENDLECPECGTKFEEVIEDED